MKLALKIVMVLIVGTVLGLLATWLTVVRGVMPGGIEDGAWKTNLANGDPRGDPYTRARVALHGFLALNRSETIYYTASHDSEGHRLRGRCRYEVTGHDPDARWWSITAYGPDEYLIPNPANRYSVSKTTIAREADGGFAIQVGGTDGGSNWIPLAPGRFSLSLRLYNPGITVTTDPGEAALPLIRRVSCS